ncbi:phosphatase [Aureibacter tunicatorum]|uniref:Phosphatase n=1 Tax=Aureibacter tunicatorum TaxID=866807 RepID=A0AAE3XLE6_9BACT|nr:phosphatase [Aureibacter tunicatorum]MDR6240051.1 hypothetical protein [Aureibacter tunicatorum]BDD04523.1 hypothetical protein AUTU_20060 [Aureibacter tunicatorum]
MKRIILSVIAVAFLGCKQESTQSKNHIKLEAHSKTPNFLKVSEDFPNLKVYPILSSEDKLSETPEFVYGSAADGAALLANKDGSFSLINNMEGDYSIARIKLDSTLKPVGGEYIVNSVGTARTAQCSGSIITPEDHGFGPLYLSGGEAGKSSRGVFATDPYKDASKASSATLLTSLGQWAVENAVALNKNAFPEKTVILIGDDHADNETPSGQLAMYIGDRGDLENGKLYGLKVNDPQVQFEVDMKKGNEYPIEFVELDERQFDLLDQESKIKGVMGFSRVEDIDWRRGNAENNREVYFCVTGRKHPALEGKGSKFGRVYKLNLNENDPTKGSISCVLDGDIKGSPEASFHSPDNIAVTQDYIYIQEDPNGYFDQEDKKHFARMYQYNLQTKAFKTVLECDQKSAEANGYGTSDKIWELTGVVDISDIINKEGTFMIISQNHGWENESFTDPKATDSPSNSEGSILYVVEGLER